MIVTIQVHLVFMSTYHPLSQPELGTKGIREIKHSPNVVVSGDSKHDSIRERAVMIKQR